ncbi:MAG TPA: acyl-CoA synthetase [Gammaproteobacteria bacterium]|nr:MAG: acyl-CoA synthetase [Gammaproteobacteria bacterium TMED134]RZO71636.1 MAG: acyl-CoA synthetase [OM182 bacterium]HAL40827.1 acyl-CoA synthetase [Gammaproteobacteria bacterium]HBK17611.1 acyl-CoA synthetase [Gammaproteobacteria bacterium]
MTPGDIAAADPDKVAYIIAETDQRVSYAELEAQANQGAQLFRTLGLRRGDHIALLLENHAAFFPLCWAAQRSGLYYTAISWRLQQQEVEYIVNNCQAKVFVTSIERRQVVEPLLDSMPGVIHRYMVDGEIGGFESWEGALANMPQAPIADQCEGAAMLYSSGTTGYPKGVKRPLPEAGYGEAEDINLLRILYGADEDSIYLSPAPLYHAAPLAFCMGCLRNGVTVVVMQHFSPEFALACIEQYRATHSQWVPTMFVRMLKLPEAERLRYDLSSLRCAIHAAAPCPIPIKEQMIEWWGKIIYEYYAGTENNGFVQLNSEEWLSHRGSVGKPLTCEVHICDEQGEEVPVGESGTIYLGGGGAFEYHGDSEKTAGSRHPKGWTTLGDVGYVDEDGYLYLTDRKHFMIISGGVNIYPQEAENVLITHDKVMDVAVFGVPNADFGEEVKGVVQLRHAEDASPQLEVELLDFCRAQLSHIKCPRSIDFRAELPRHPTGKLYKRLLKDEYWSGA